MKKPDYNLGMRGGTHAEQTGKVRIEIEKILGLVKPDCVLEERYQFYAGGGAC